MGSTFGKSGSGSSDSPFRNSGSGSLDPHLEKVDPGRILIFVYGDSRAKSDTVLFFYHIKFSHTILVHNYDADNEM